MSMNAAETCDIRRSVWAENLPVPVANDEEPTSADAKAAGAAAKTPAHPHTPARG